MLIGWALFGALIGLAAAQKKGFSAAGGIIGGLLLGPLAFLMFFISGISAADSNRKKCPYCAEFVQRDAVVCKHCGRDISPRALVRARHAAEAQKRTPPGQSRKSARQKARRRAFDVAINSFGHASADLDGVRVADESPAVTWVGLDLRRVERDRKVLPVGLSGRLSAIKPRYDHIACRS